MADELDKAIAIGERLMQASGAPAVVKAFVGVGGVLVTGIQEAKARNLATRQAELRRFGIPVEDPFGVYATRKLEQAKRLVARADEERQLSAMRSRLDASDAARPQDKGWVAPRAGAAWEGKHKNDAVTGYPAPAGEVEAPNLLDGIGGGG